MAKAFENPLLPHTRIRQLFRAMLEARAMAQDPHASACAIALSAGLRDLGPCSICVPDEQLHPSLSLALGRTRRQVERGACAAELQEALGVQPSEQLYFALGSAASSPTLTLLLLSADLLRISHWKRLLTDAAKVGAPVVIATLPSTRPGLAALSSTLGLPGIAVDAADPLALYRVAGESFGRAKAGGGPALIEAVSFPDAPDPLTLLRRQMIGRGAATERWACTVEQQCQAPPGLSVKKGTLKPK